MIAKNVPGLTIKLREAGMSIEPYEFVKQTFMASFYLTTSVVIVLGAIFAKLNVLLEVLYFVFPFLFIVFFLYFLEYPDVRILKKKRAIDREIIFAGRFLIVELESGVPLYNAFRNVSKSYKSIGSYFKEIIDNVDLGTPMEEALNEAMEFSPSQDFRRLLWQVINSLKTGADINLSLNNIIDQITKEQVIKIKEYGRKLNPLAMFYMMIAVIIPSLGITLMIILSTFLNIQLSLSILLLISFFIGVIQFMFIAIVKSSRPAVEL